MISLLVFPNFTPNLLLLLQFFSFLAQKNAENDYFDQSVRCPAPKRLSKFTTIQFSIYLVLWIRSNVPARARASKILRLYWSSRFLEMAAMTLRSSCTSILLCCTHGEYKGMESLFAHPLPTVKLTHPLS